MSTAVRTAAVAAICVSRASSTTRDQKWLDLSSSTGEAWRPGVIRWSRAAASIGRCPRRGLPVVTRRNFSASRSFLI
jgi:hypothetical protein